MRKIFTISTIAATALLLGAGANSFAADTDHQNKSKAGVKIGVLSCGVEGGMGYVIGSSRTVDCYYSPASGKRREHYVGTLGKLGVDIGITKETRLVWVVMAPGKVGKGALKGTYLGASASASVVVGGGVNVLVGGFRDTVSLQPLSGQGQVGLNAAAGLASLHLKYVTR